MTKPADSDQIAKARERLKAHKFECGSSSNPADYYVEFAVKFAASERQAVIEECAKVAEDPANREPGWSLSTQRMIAMAIRSMERDAGKEGETT